MAEKSAAVTFKQLEPIVKTIMDGTMQHVKRLEERIAELERNAIHDEGVHVEGRSYGTGALVTFKNSAWICRQPTCDRPGTSEAWRLVSRGAKHGF